MSRLAAAFRKASAGGQTRPAPLQPRSMWDVVHGPFAGAQVPWEFADAVEQRRDSAAAPAVARPASVAVASPTRRTAGGSAGEELAAMVRRIYEPGHAVNRRRAILFAAVDADGSSARLSATVADLLASQTSASVCLVDANLRSPSLNQRTGEVATGLSELLIDGGALRSAVIAVSANLWLLPAGARGPEALQRLTVEQLRPRLHELLATFDYLVVSAGPVTAHGDAAILAPLMDGVVLTVAARSTRKEAGRRAVENLQQAGATVLGVILAERVFPIPEALYRRL